MNILDCNFSSIGDKIGKIPLKICIRIYFLNSDFLDLNENNDIKKLLDKLGLSLNSLKIIMKDYFTLKKIFFFPTDVNNEIQDILNKKNHHEYKIKYNYFIISYIPSLKVDIKVLLISEIQKIEKIFLSKNPNEEDYKKAYYELSKILAELLSDSIKPI